MSELPEGWTLATLGELGNYINGRAFKPFEWKKTGLPIVRIQNLTESSSTFNYSDQEHEEKYRLKDGDLLIAWSASLGAFIWNKGNAWLNQHIFRVEPNKGIVTKEFLYYAVTRSIEGLYDKSHGSGMVHVTKPVFESHQIPIPPLNEQRRIVAKLEKLLNRVDAAQARIATIPRILKRFRQSVLAAGCSGQLTADWRQQNPNTPPAAKLIRDKDFRLVISEDDLQPLPNNWEWVPLGNYAKCSRGRFSVRPRNDPRFFGGEYPFIQIGNLPSDGGWITSHRQTLNEKGLDVSKKFPKGTVVIAIVGATIGNTGILSYDMCFTDSMVGLETGSEVGNVYVEFFLRSRKEDIRQSSYAGGGQPNIKLETLNPYPLALPPFVEQEEIVRRVEALFKTADALEARYRSVKAHVDKLTQSILAKAFRGELVPQNPNDEPASALLERIQKVGVGQAVTSRRRKEQ